MTKVVDLRQLAVRRDEPALVSGPRRRHWLTRYVLPGLVLLGFSGVVIWAARDSLLPARSVTVLPVLTTRAEVQQAGTPLFQAAGWVEPRPAPIIVSALTEGVIEELLVVENQEVQAGQPVARLIAIDAKLAVEAARADVQLREAELSAAHAAETAARINLEQPVQLQANLAEVEAQLARVELESSNLPLQLRAAKARRELARQHHAIKKQAYETGGLPLTQLQQAASELEAAEAQVQELEKREPRLKQELTAQASRREALRRRLELKADEQRALTEAQANRKAAEAKLAQARVALERAELQHHRTTVRSPVEGRVLALVARRGSRLTGYDPSVIVTLYDPKSLQIRADVRFEDLPRVQPGQEVRIHSPALPAPLTGKVLFTTGQADIQKNTLQVKVELPTGATLLRPDMLVQTTFLAPPNKSASEPAERLRLLIPRQLVETAEGNSWVWVADAQSRTARRKSVQLGLPASTELVEVVAGLNAGDRLIVGGKEGLREGERIVIRAEDTTLGVHSGTGSRTGGMQRLHPGGGKKDH